MKLLSSVRLNKYLDASKYEPVNSEGKAYKKLDGSGCFMTFYSELEEDEDTEFPLNDLLDKYNIKRTNYSMDTEKDGKRIFVFEVEASAGDGEQNEKTIKNVALLTGKRVYNQQVGDFIELKIKNIG